MLFKNFKEKMKRYPDFSQRHYELPPPRREINGNKWKEFLSNAVFEFWENPKELINDLESFFQRRDTVELLDRLDWAVGNMLQRSRRCSEITAALRILERQIAQRRKTASFD